MREVLVEIDAAGVPELLVFNKSDARAGAAKQLVADHPGSVAISAATGAGVDELLVTLSDRLRSLAVVYELVVPFDRGDVLASVHREGRSCRSATTVRTGPCGPGCPTRRPVVSPRTGRTATAAGWTRDLDPLRSAAVPVRPAQAPRADTAAFAGGTVDLSIGTPFDAPPDAVLAALGGSGSERGYPPSIGTVALREAAVAVDRSVDSASTCRPSRSGDDRQQGVRRDAAAVAVAAQPRARHGAVPGDLVSDLRDGSDARPVSRGPGAAAPGGGLDLSAISDEDAERALVLWVNSPSNPTGALDDLPAPRRGVVDAGSGVLRRVLRRVHLDRPARTILESGLDGVVAVHSLSKRSNLAGVRVGFYAGDADLVHYLQEIRKHVGMMVPGPAQAAGVAALDDDDHVEVQRDRYRSRLALLADVFGAGPASTSPSPPGRSTCGFRSTTAGGSPSGWRRTGAPSSAPASSTARTGLRSCASPWYNLTNDSTGGGSSVVEELIIMVATAYSIEPSPPEAAGRAGRGCSSSAWSCWSSGWSPESACGSPPQAAR